MAEEEFACPGEIHFDKVGNPHETEWHKEGKCKVCKGRGKRRFIGGMPEIDRMGKPKVDFCCHQCKSNHEAQGRQYERTSIT